MDEEREVSNNRELLTALICIAMSVLFSRMSLASLFFNLPLLLFAPKIKKTGHAVLTFVVSMVIIVALTLFDYRGYLNSSNVGIILFVLYFQVVSSIGAIFWTACRNYSDSVLRKLVICSYPIAFIGLLFSVSLSLPFATEWAEGIKQSVSMLINTDVLGINSETFAEMFLSILKMILVPMGLVFSALPILIAEFWIKKADENWQYGFANMKMPDGFIWVFMGAWIVSLISMVTDMPEWAAITGWNVALGLSLHYYVGGLSIVTARIRKKSVYISAFRIFIPVILLSMLPGINIAVISGLTILGALETWIKLR